MSVHNILAKCDRSLAAYLVSVGAGTSADVVPAKLSLNKPLPNTTCASKRWRPLVENSGVYLVTSEIHVRSDPSADSGESAEEKLSASDERVSATWDAFFAVGTGSEALAAAITAAGRAAGVSDFTCQSCVATGGDAGFDARGNSWVDALDLEMVCFPSDS